MLWVTPVATPACAGVTLPAVMAGYARSTQAGDMTALARLYGRSGILVGAGGAPLTGAGEVGRFLRGFAAYHVMQAQLTAERITPAPHGWRVTGRFSQRGTAPDGTPFAVGGQVDVQWRCTVAGWRVARMATAPGE